METSILTQDLSIIWKKCTRKVTIFSSLGGAVVLLLLENSYRNKKVIEYIDGKGDMKCFKKGESDCKPTIKFLGLFDCVSLQV